MPVAGSIRRTAIVPEFWWPARMKRPVGSIVKCRGFLPPIGAWPAGVRRPVAASTRKTARLSSPRFDP